jgi:CubicO group peptidase (beta-lactamase class C family)
MKLNKKKLVLILSLSTIIFLYFSSPLYIKRAIIYIFPEIDDYKIFHNREVAIKKGNPWPKAHDYMHNELLQSERDTLEHYNSVAYLIIQHDSIVYEEYWDGYNESSLSNSFSISKSVVGLLIGAAIKDGYIRDINQPVGDFIPVYKNPPNHQLTIKHLLTMSSGLNWEESYNNPFSITTKAYYGNNIQKLVLDLKVVEKPGHIFNYKSGNTQLLSLIIKNATNKNLSTYFSEKIWGPIGAEHPALWCLDREDGYEKAYCCINSNARDFARIGKFILDNGSINQKQVISKEYINQSISPATHLIDKDKNQVDFYGYQFWIANFNGKQIPYARGILGQYIFILKEERAIVVRLGHKRSKCKINQHPSDIFSYINTANRILNSRKVKRLL